MKYIYMFEEGHVAIDAKGPTDVDLEMIADGCLEVIQIESASASHGDSRPMMVLGISADGSTYNLQPCNITKPSDFFDDEPEDNRPFHSL